MDHKLFMVAVDLTYQEQQTRQAADGACLRLAVIPPNSQIVVQ